MSIYQENTDIPGLRVCHELQFNALTHWHHQNLNLNASGNHMILEIFKRITATTVLAKGFCIRKFEIRSLKIG